MEIAPNQYSIDISRSFCMYTIKHAKYCIKDFIALSNTTQVHEVSDPEIYKIITKQILTSYHETRAMQISASAARTERIIVRAWYASTIIIITIIIILLIVDKGVKIRIVIGVN